MKTLTAYALVLLYSCTLIGCETPLPTHSSEVTIGDRSLERVTRSGELRCGYIVWPLLFEIDPNTRQMRGLMYDITEELARRAKIKVTWVEEVHFGNIAQALRSGKIDAICSGVWEITERGREMQFSEPIAFNPAKIFVPSESPIRSYHELLTDTSLRMVTVDGEMSSLLKDSTFPQHKEISLPKESDGPSLLLHLVLRKADFTLTDTGSVHIFENARPGSLREIPGFPAIYFPISYVTMRGEHQLTHLFNLGVRELRRGGSIAAVAKKYDPKSTFLVAQ